MPLQGFIKGYGRLCGMTGTATAAADELWETYGAPVVVVPPHRPNRRRDWPDKVFADRETKERAVVEEVVQAHTAGRPVLVGTRTVAESENLAARLAAAGIACRVLNARDESEEAGIVASAGALAAVTISTNMAGRGTDIALGGADGSTRDPVVALGGLYVIGTCRHESARVDQQLRGRAGRQGDPGETRFLTSLDDDLIVRYGPTHPVGGLDVACAQRMAEEQNRELRRTLAMYAAVLDEQYAAFRARREAVLHTGADGERVLASLDAHWRRHLELCDDMREGIHLVRLGGRDPVAIYAGALLTPLFLLWGIVNRWGRRKVGRRPDVPK